MEISSTGSISGIIRPSEMNDFIRGKLPQPPQPAEGEPEVKRIPSANAGNGAASPGVGSAPIDMNAFIRSTRNRSWTSHG